MAFIRLESVSWGRIITVFCTMIAMSVIRITRVSGFAFRRELARKSLQQPSFLPHHTSTFVLAASVTTTTTKVEEASATNEDSAASIQSDVDLKGIDWVQDMIVEVLNDLYDPADVARGNVLAKLRKPKKKKKKKKNADNAVGGDEPPEMSEEEKMSLADEAAAKAPSLFTRADAMVTPATKPEFGDYQVNAAMGLARALGLNPIQCAQQIVDGLKNVANREGEGDLWSKLVKEPEIAGPGFINLQFSDDYLCDAVRAMADDAQGRLAVPAQDVEKTQRIVVDYSSPNIAKEMHVGHLRSTIIGDTLSNLLEFQGHNVARLNHVGDWGTQFGMLVEHLRDAYPEALDKETARDVELGDLVLLYKTAKKRFDDEEDFKQRAREGVVKLQAGQPEEIAAWEALCLASRVEYEKIYKLLNINTGLQERGESFYNPFLNGVVEDLEELGMAQESEGATVVFLEGYTNRDGSPLPMIIRKSDGGFNYATTDLAAVRQRTWPREQAEGEKSMVGEDADRILYVTDAGQAQHFEMVFAAAKKAKFCPEDVSLEHVPFGLVQGEDGKKFATRSGETVKLKDLLNEAVRIAGSDLKSRNQETDPEFEARVDRVSEIVGIGAVKYADLSMNRESNYRFSYERMLSLNGNTAPYMLYAYARICGIIRKATGKEEINDVVWPEAADNILISHPSERELIRNLVKLPDVINEVERDLYPNRICDYLFETSQKFNQFYESCSVNNAETPELKESRLSLCTATAGTIRLLLRILGIPVVEKL